jgi:hypothetical protein
MTRRRLPGKRVITADGTKTNHWRLECGCVYWMNNGRYCGHDRRCPQHQNEFDEELAKMPTWEKVLFRIFGIGVLVVGFGIALAFFGLLLWDT